MKKVFFGAGQIAEKEIAAGTIPEVIFDNNTELHGTQFLSYNVSNPNDMRGFSFDKIVICSSSITDIIEQITAIGIPSDKIEISSFIGNMARTFSLEQYRFSGFVSSGLPSTTRSLKGGGIYSVEELEDSVVVKKVYEGNTHGMVHSGGNLIFTCQGVGIVVYHIETAQVSKVVPIPTGFRAHGIREINDHFFVACSSGDCILQLTPDGDVEREYMLSNKIAKRGTAQHHVNDLYVTDDYIYASMFSISGNWKRGAFDGGVVEIDRLTGVVIPMITNLKMPHSITCHEGSFYVLDSYRGRVCGYDSVSMGSLGGFVRGLDFSDNFLIVGESKNRNISKLEARNMFSAIDTRITVIDPESKASRSISLPRGVSEIHAVIAID